MLCNAKTGRPPWEQLSHRKLQSSLSRWICGITVCDNCSRAGPSMPRPLGPDGQAIDRHNRQHEQVAWALLRTATELKEA